MRKNLFKHISLVFLFFILAASMSVISYAQTIKKDKIDIDPDIIILNLDEDEQDLADEYLDILEQLKETIEDFKDYLSDIDETNPCDNAINFEIFEKGLASGLYAEDIKMLKSDIEDYTDNLRNLQRDFRESEDINARDCYRITRSLQRELSILNNLIDKNITSRFVQKLKDEKFANYLKDAILKFTQNILKGHQLTELEKQLTELEEQLEGMEDFEVIEIPPIPAIPEIPEIPPIPVIPDEGRSRVKTIIDLDGTSRESGLAKVYTAVQSVSSPNLPININNPLGGIIILGNNDKKLEAVLNLEVAADSRIREKSFTEASSLEIREDKNGYFVNVSFPKLTDPHTKILNSLLTLSLPSRNHVICKSSFGPIKASNLLNGLVLNSSYAEIKLNDIKGEVKVTNSMNTVELRNINGPLTVTNSYSPIMIYDCSGKMEIANAYAQVSIFNSSGEARIKNSGQTEVQNHKGDINIDNSYGLVKVDNLYGNLKANNNYSPIETNIIKGTVTLGNTYSLVSAVDIEGSLTVENKYGKIDARYLNGPFQIINENGDISVVINNPLKGSSSISAISGTMNIALNKETDIFLKAQTKDGQIKSTYPLKLIDLGNMQSGELILGRGKDSLSLFGNRTDIIIKETK